MMLCYELRKLYIYTRCGIIRPEVRGLQCVCCGSPAQELGLPSGGESVKHLWCRYVVDDTGKIAHLSREEINALAETGKLEYPYSASYFEGSIWDWELSSGRKLTPWQWGHVRGCSLPADIRFGRDQCYRLLDNSYEFEVSIREEICHSSEYRCHVQKTREKTTYLEDFKKWHPFTLVTSKVLEGLVGSGEADILPWFIRHYMAKWELEDRKSEGFDGPDNNFGGYVIGFLYRDLDVRQYDFSIPLLLRSDSFEARKKFVLENKEKLISIALRDIQNSTKVKNKVGDLSFYELSEITVRRVPEVEFTFSVKGISGKNLGRLTAAGQRG